MAGDELFEAGLKTRKQVLGAEYVEANLADADDFMMTLPTSRYGTGLGLCVEPSRPRPEDAEHIDPWHPRRTGPLSRTRHLHECCSCQRCNRR